jgi:F-type H+-transporting ATPase subunit delta
MQNQIHNSPLALSYAKALLELANEGNLTQQIGEDLRDLREILSANPMFVQVLADPAIGNEERGRLLKTVFENRTPKLLQDFLGLLNEKNRLNILAAIADAFDELLDQQFGKIEVDVTVAERLTVDQLEGVRQKVSSALKRDAVVHQYVDASIIGGVILRVKDQLIDGSVRAQLTGLKHRLLNARPK